MEKGTIFRDRQELQGDDLNNIITYGRDSLDHIVVDGISEERGWTGFSAAKTGTAELTISEGRAYFDGAVYVQEADTVFDLLGSLPNSNKKWVAIVAFGEVVEDQTEPRDFLINPVNNSTEPQSVPMRTIRVANIDKVEGIAAPQPLKPTVGTDNVVIAYVLLNSSDIESISLETVNIVPQVRREKLRVDDLAAWRAIVGPRVDTLASDLASIKALIGTLGQSQLIDQVAIDVARVKEALEIEDDATDYGSDRFLDADESLAGDVNFLAKVEEGVRFSDAAANSVNLELFNPLNSDVILSAGNFLLPKFTENQRFKVGPFAEEHSISQYQFQTHSFVQRTVSRTRIRYGEDKTVCTNSSWWRSGKYNPVTKIFTIGGETWEFVSGNPAQNHKGVRLRRFWVDTYEEHYWDRIVVDHSINGQQIGQTFLNPQDGWLTSVGLYFTQKGGVGDVNVAICKVRASGEPDLDNALTLTTLQLANIVVSGDGTLETKLAIPATFLEAGKRYAIVLTTGGNHYVALAVAGAYAQGTFFFSLDGASQQALVAKDMMFSLYYAQFAKVRTVVELESMSLSGGIAAIDIIAAAIIPSSCELTYEVQVSGVWTALAEVKSGNTILFGLPALLPFRAIFVGTTDVQPGIDMEDAVVRYNRPRTTFKHISATYTLASSSDDFKVVAILENYYETNHNLTCTIQANATGSQINPATTVDVELDPPLDPTDGNHKRIKRTFTWTPTQITSPMSSVRITMDGATTSALDTFHVGERVHLAF